MRTPLREIRDPWRHSVRMQSKPKHIDWWSHQLETGSRHQWRNCLVRCDQGPMTVDGDSWVRFVARKYQIDRSPRRAESRVSKRPLRENWCISRGYYKNISLA